MNREIVRPVEADGWDVCPTPDCENKVCRWGGLGVCHPCSVRLVGAEEMLRRYHATRVSATDHRWTGVPYWAATPTEPQTK